jgi:ABC-type bacteriocin/lantibiotic exporter with double-glycine peptidase domain
MPFKLWEIFRQSRQTSAPVNLHQGVSVGLIARQLGVPLTPDRVELAFRENQVKDRHQMCAVFRSLGLVVNFRAADLNDLEVRRYLFPCVAVLKDGRALVLAGVSTDQTSGEKRVTFIDAFSSVAKPESKPLSLFAQEWSGQIALVSRDTGVESQARPFDWQWFIPEILRFRWILLVAFVISLVLHLLAFAPIIYIQIALDKVVGFKAVSTLYVLSAAIFFALLFNVALGYLRDYLIGVIGAALEARMTGDVFDKLLALPAQILNSRPQSELESAVTGVTTVRLFLTRNVLTGLFELAGLLVFIPLLFFYSGILALIVVGFAVLMGVVQLGMRSYEKNQGKAVVSGEREKNRVLRETLMGMDTVKSLSLGPEQRRNWRKTASSVIRFNSVKEAAASLSSQVNGGLQQAMTVVIIFAGVQLVFEGLLSAGALIAVNMIAARVIRPVTMAITSVGELERVNAAVSQIGTVWNATSERKGLGQQFSLRGRYELQSVTVEFAGAKKAIDNASLLIEPGSLVGIVGPSASGKSTLLRLLQGNLRPSSGQLLIEGHSLPTIDLEHYRKQLSYLPAQPTFFSGTIEDNIRRGRLNLSDREFDEAVELSGLSRLLSDLPGGLSANLDEAASSLPGSFRQVLALTRALAASPRVMLLDEAFSNVDKPTTVGLYQRIRKIAANRTVILVTHDLRFTQGFDQIIVMNKGQLVAQGTHNSLLATCAQYERSWKLELGYSDTAGATS